MVGNGHRRESVSTKSANVFQERQDKFRSLFPEVFTEGKIDIGSLLDALGEQATIDYEIIQTRLSSNGGLIEFVPERYKFTWTDKQEAIGLLQKTTSATLVPAPEESVHFDSTQHLFIEGENLEVLKLLYKPYFGRVKMIYIDPPYNTGQDFIYPDDYETPLETYLQRTGQSDRNGNWLSSNPEQNGRYHSKWLTMMYPRLFVARQLLRDDGVIFVSIDDHEIHHLRLLMNEIFGEESFFACFIWHRRQNADNRNKDRASTDHEYVLGYRKSEAVLRGEDIDLSKYKNPDNDPRGPWFSADITGLANRDRRPNLHYNVINPETGDVYSPSPTRGWAVSRERFQEYIKKDLILWPSRPDGRPRRKKFLKDVTNFQTGFSSILDVGFTSEGTRELQSLFGEKIFQFPKPVSLIKALVRQATTEDEKDIVLDFFAGSCTGAQAVLELNREDGGNRRFIMVQLPEPTERDDYSTIAEIGKERIRRVIAQIQAENEGQLPLYEDEDLGFRVFKLTASNFQPWPELTNIDGETYVHQVELNLTPLADAWQARDLVYEVALKEGLSLTSEIEVLENVGGHTVYRLHDPDKEQTIHICLDGHIGSVRIIEQLGLSQEDLFFCRDTALDDTVGSNLELNCRLRTF